MHVATVCLAAEYIGPPHASVQGLSPQPKVWPSNAKLDCPPGANAEYHVPGRNDEPARVEPARVESFAHTKQQEAP